VRRAGWSAISAAFPFLTHRSHLLSMTAVMEGSDVEDQQDEGALEKTSGWRNGRFLKKTAAFAAAVAVGVVAAAGLDAALLGRGAQEQSSETVAERIAALEAAPLRLTMGDGEIDLLLVAAADCSHCQDFHEEGLEMLIDEARKRNLDLFYAQTLVGRRGLEINGAKKCLAAAGLDLPAKDWVDVGYAMARMSPGNDLDPSTMFPTLASAMTLIEVEGVRFDACLAAGQAEVVKEAQEIASRLYVKGTPTLIFNGEDGGSLQQAGAPNETGIINALDSAAKAQAGNASSR
jgi:hypothetical protein